MSAPLTSLGDREPPKGLVLENACRIAAFRLREARYLSVNTIPIREQIKDSVKFVAPGLAD